MVTDSYSGTGFIDIWIWDNGDWGEFGQDMKLPKGLTLKLEYVKDGRIYFDIIARRFYLFKAILRIAGQNMQNPVSFLLIVVFAFYYLIKMRKH